MFIPPMPDRIIPVSGSASFAEAHLSKHLVFSVSDICADSSFTRKRASVERRGKMNSR